MGLVAVKRMKMTWTYDTLMDCTINGDTLLHTHYLQWHPLLRWPKPLHVFIFQWLRDSCLGISWLALLENHDYFYSGMPLCIVSIDFEKNCWVAMNPGRAQVLFSCELG